jgi:site-specific recombinase XerD
VLRDKFQVMTLNKVIEMFYLDLKVGERSAKTIDFYRQHIDMFLKHSTMGDRPIEDVTVQHIESYLLSKNTAQFSKHASFRTLRALFYFAARRQLITDNPVKQIRTPKLPKREIPIVSREDFVSLRNSCGQSFLGHRDRAILNILYECGLRLSELTSMTFDNLDMENKEITVIGKGNKERVVSFGDETRTSLLRFLQNHPMDSNYLWLTEEKNKPIHGHGIQSMLVHRCKHVGLARIHPHMFRHSCATNLLKNGCPINSVRLILGQESLSVLLGYLKTLNSKDASVEHMKYSPMKNL